MLTEWHGLLADCNADYLLEDSHGLNGISGPEPIVVIVTDMGSWHVAGASGPVGWSVGTVEKWPQSCGSGPAQMAVLYSPGIQYLSFPSSQTRWRPLQWPERPERERDGERKCVWERQRWGSWWWGCLAFPKSLITTIVEIFSAYFFLAFLIQKAPSQHALQALLRIPIRDQTISHKTERQKEREKGEMQRREGERRKKHIKDMQIQLSGVRSINQR